MSGQQDKPKANKGKRKNECLDRMDFLFKASQTLAKTKSDNPAALDFLSARLGSHCSAVGKKAVLRIAPEAKRSLCKGCGLSLVPGRTCRVSTEGKTRKGKKVTLECGQCRTTKSYPVREKVKTVRVKKSKKK